MPLPPPPPPFLLVTSHLRVLWHSLSPMQVHLHGSKEKQLLGRVSLSATTQTEYSVFLQQQYLHPAISHGQILWTQMYFQGNELEYYSF